MVLNSKKIVDTLREEKITILVILLSAFVLFYNLDGRLLTADELTFASRSADQLTRPQLTFFDEPPVYFDAMALIYQVLGISTTAARSLSVLASALTLAVVYLIGKKLFNRRVGLISAVILGFSLFFLTWSRLAYIEPFLTLFFALSAYYLLTGIKENSGKKAYYSVGIAAFTTLIKHTGFIFFFLVPIFAILKRKQLLLKLSKFIPYTLVVFLAFSSITIAYNYMLYSKYGILDYQFSRALGMNVPEYNILFGTSVHVNPTMVFYGLFNSLYNLYQYDIIFFGLATVAIVFALWRFRKDSSVQFMLFWLLSLLLLFSTYVDSSQPTTVFGFAPNWFVTFLPAAAILSGLFLNSLIKNKIVLLLILVFVAGYSLGIFSNSLFVHDTRPFNQLTAYLSNTDSSQPIIVDNKVYAGYWAWYLYNKCAVRNIDYNITSETNSTELIIVKFDGDNLGWAQPQDSGIVVPTNSLPTNVILANGQPFFEIYKVNAKISSSTIIDCSRLKAGFTPKTISK